MSIAPGSSGLFCRDPYVTVTEIDAFLEMSGDPATSYVPPLIAWGHGPHYSESILRA